MQTRLSANQSKRTILFICHHHHHHHHYHHLLAFVLQQILQDTVGC